MVEWCHGVEKGMAGIENTFESKTGRPFFDHL